MEKHVGKVKDFMIKAKQEVPESPTMPDVETRLLRARLIFEECREMIVALGFDIYVMDGHNAVTMPFKLLETYEPNMVEIADAVADVNVVSNGTALACGINPIPIQDMVDDSNLEKFKGDAHECPDTGKWIKPSDWLPPNIKKELDSQ